MPSPVRLLIASLGNPPPYHNTRHSAGHVLLRALASSLNFPTLTTRSKEYAGAYISSSPGRPEYTLYQSPTQMNVSGPTLLKAWRHFQGIHASAAPGLGLVILHDELESAPGTLKLRRSGTSSARGHNGIKSVQASLASAGVLGALGDRFAKIGIGIGRPVSRERDDVSDYVLGTLTQQERMTLETAVGNLEAILQAETDRLEREAT